MKVLKTIYYVFLGAIALIALLLIVSIFPITGNYKILSVLSGSMEPTVKTGSVVIVKPSADYEIGDIITFGQITKTKVPITHRVHDIKVQNGEPVYITKGDANNAPDTREVRKSEIIGKVLFDAPYMGYALDTARKPYGFMALIILPAAIIIYDEGRKIWGEVGNLKNQKKDKEISGLKEAIKNEI